MTPKTRSLLFKVIIITASICLGAFIAFEFFKTGVQEIVDAQEIVESSSPSLPTNEDAAMSEVLEGESPLTWAWGPIEDRGLEAWWNNMPEEERKNHKFASGIELAIRENNEYLEGIKKAEQEKTKETPKPAKKIEAPAAKKPETKKLEQAKTTTPKAPEKKPAAVKPQEPKGKKAQPMTPSKTPEPKKIEKPTIVAPAKAEPVKPATPKELAKPMVTVKNNIQKTMTGYKKFGKNWYPDEYSLTINGVQVEEGEQVAVPAGDGSVCNVVFAYDFRPMGKSYKKGTEEVSYVLKPGTKELDITFSWYKTPCIIVTPFVEPGAGNQIGSKAKGA